MALATMTRYPRAPAAQVVISVSLLSPMPGEMKCLQSLCHSWATCYLH